MSCYSYCQDYWPFRAITNKFQQVSLLPATTAIATTMPELPTIIQEQDELHLLVQRAIKTDAVAFDTEFVWERTYFPQLGLIQLALSDEQCYLIDPLSLSDLKPLGNLLADRSVVKILHDAQQDLAILYRATGIAPQNIFDTRLAAGFANLPATLSLGSLIKELLDIDLTKDQTRTDWLHRPLSEEQVQYALDDVRYLRAVRVLLLSRLIGPKLKTWLQEELNLLNNPANYIGPDDSERFRRIRGANNLNRQELALLRNLTTWREGMARKLNRPRGHLITDSQLLNIARCQPGNKENLAEQCGLSKNRISKYGHIITAIVQTTIDQSKKFLPEPIPHHRLTSRQKGALDNLLSLITLKCSMLGMDPILVGNQSELKTLIKTLSTKNGTAEPEHVRQTEGWRKSFLEDFLRQNRRKNS
jgi:ribonuclease D